MGEISSAKLDILRRVVEAAPDAVVRGLAQAFSSDGPYDAALAAVRALLDNEIQDRRVRNTVLIAVAPLCRPAIDDRLTFPSRALSLMWRGLKHELPSECDQAAALLAEWREDDGPAMVFDLLCTHAGEALQSAAAGAFADAAMACESLRPGLAATLSACLELSPIARRSIARLPDWLGRMTGEKSAELRLAYRDVCAVSDDAGPLFFEILAAHLTEPWHILRIISGVMERPAEAYLAGSELSPMADRLFADIDEQLAVVTRFGPHSTPAEARQAAQAIDRAVHQIAEIEQCITLSPAGPWGRRVAAQKKSLALKVEGHLRSMEELVSKALPLHTVRIGPRTLKGVPRLSTEPEPLLVARATTLLVFANEVRPSAAVGGFASTRSKVMETVCARMDQYIEDLLDHLRAELEPDAEDDHDRARAYLEVVADFSALARDEKAAQIVRRRAAAA